MLWWEHEGPWGYLCQLFILVNCANASIPIYINRPDVPGVVLQRASYIRKVKFYYDAAPFKTKYSIYICEEKELEKMQIKHKKPHTRSNNATLTQSL